MRRLLIIASLLLLTSGSAFAQPTQANTPVQSAQGQQQNQYEVQLGTEWSSLQLAQQHFTTALVKVIEEWHKDKISLDAERKYWIEYVKGLYPSK